MHHIFSEVQHRLWSGIVYTLEEWSIINKPQLKNNCFLLCNDINFILSPSFMHEGKLSTLFTNLLTAITSRVATVILRMRRNDKVLSEAEC